MVNSLEKLKPSKHKRELVILFLISIITIPSLIFFTYENDEGLKLYPSEVPIINIEISNEITNFSQQCNLRIFPISIEFKKYGWANHFLLADIRKRNSDGGLSFELYQNENLFQIRNDDDWLLLPSGENIDALRTKLACDVYNMLKENNSNYNLPDSKIVEIYINGEYEGLYLLSERIDRKLMNLDEENLEDLEENDIIFKTTNWDGDFFTIPNSIDCIWEQIFPNQIDFSHVPIDITSYILNTSEEAFFNKINGIFTKFDKDLLIDNLLFGLIVGHDIIEGSTYYLMSNHKNIAPFSFIPWNFKQSWGFSKYGIIPLDLWLNEDNKEISSIVWNNLYHRLLFPENSSINDEFIIDIINRWSYIRSNFWNPEDLITYFNNIYLPIQNSLIRSTNSSDLVINSVNTIKNWITTRFNLLDNIITGQDINFTDFESPYQEDDEIFGFSSSAARRYFYKSSTLFSTKKIHEVNVSIKETYFSDIMVRKHDNDSVTEHLYVPSEVSIDNHSIDNAGFRIRANFNTIFPKDSFKIKFSETQLYVGNDSYNYVPENENRRFLGLQRINLRAAPTDFSFMDEVAGYELFRILGIPCARISWAKLYITETDENGKAINATEYKGLYLLTEDIDKTFIRCNFKNPEGNLYKTTGINASLEYVENLKEFIGNDNRRFYELRTNEELDDYSDLEKFIQYINYNWSLIPEVASIDLLAKYFAASNFMGNWDDYVFLPHNYYLYSEPNYGFMLIPWDIEHNFNSGSNQSVVDTNAPDFRNAPLLSGYENWYDNISIWARIPSEPRPLWDNLINDTNFIEAYLHSHKTIISNFSSLITQVEQWFNFIESTVLLPFNLTDPEPYFEYPTQIDIVIFTIEKFRVLNFLNGRKQFVEDQLV